MSHTPSRFSSISPRFGLNHTAKQTFSTVRSAVKRVIAVRLLRSLRGATALLLLVSLTSPVVTLARQSDIATDTPNLKVGGGASIFSSFSESLTALLGLAQAQNMPQRERPLPERKEPQLPPTKAEREAKVGSIKLESGGDLTIQSGRRRILMAIPLDHDGNPIHGLLVEWESSDKNIVTITKDGLAVAGNPGKAKLMASAGQKQVQLKVTVVEAVPGPQNSFARATHNVESIRVAKTSRQSKHHREFITPTPQDPQLPGPDVE